MLCKSRSKPYFEGWARQGEQAIRLKVLKGASKTQLQLSAETFFLDREAAGCTEATLKWYRKYVGALVDYMAEQGLTELALITATHLRAWLVSLQERKLGERSIHHHASAARTFFNFCIAVSFRRNRGKWLGHICYVGQIKLLGHYDGEIEAAKAYDRAARELHGEFAFTNF